MPMMNVFQLGYLLFTYLLCAIPFGVLVSRFVVGQDVRSQGSGNIGATNVARMMGKKWGVFVLLLDAMKGFVAVGLSKHVGPAWYCNVVLVIAVLAHCYPVYLKFKGGKGVATAVGALAGLSWPLTGLCILVFLIAVASSRRVSAGSLSAALSAPIFATVFHFDVYPVTALLLCIIVCWKHQENIRRLVARTEPRFF